MRGIIKCELIFSNVNKESKPEILLKFLDELPWSPPLLDTHPEIDKRLKKLFSEFPEKSSYLSETNLKTLHHAASETWIIITESTLDTLDIRLSNPIAERLKQASEAIVNALTETAAKKEFSSFFKLEFRVFQILDNKSDVPVYFGEIIQPNIILAAINEQKLETAIGCISLLLAAIFLYITSPLADALFQTISSTAWSSWFYNNAIQISTGTLVTSFVSFLKITLYIFDLRKAKPIRWKLS